MRERCERVTPGDGELGDCGRQRGIGRFLRWARYHSAAPRGRRRCAPQHQTDRVAQNHVDIARARERAQKVGQPSVVFGCGRARVREVQVDLCQIDLRCALRIGGAVQEGGRCKHVVRTEESSGGHGLAGVEFTELLRTGVDHDGWELERAVGAGTRGPKRRGVHPRITRSRAAPRVIRRENRPQLRRHLRGIRGLPQSIDPDATRCKVSEGKGSQPFHGNGAIGFL